MKTVQKYLAQKQREFAQHPFFNHIVEGSTLEELASFAQRMTFWIMTFQDVLRLNEARFMKPEFRKIARDHRLEDEGHNLWFLSDLNQMKREEPNLRLLYSHDYTATRDAAYALVSEVFRARNDYERIAFLLAIESGAYIFFKHTSDFVERIGYSSTLKYFSNHHFDVEENHKSLGDSLENYFNSIYLTQEEEKNIFELIDRVYEAVRIMFNGLEAALNKAKIIV
jgi:hypothetical protein